MLFSEYHHLCAKRNLKRKKRVKGGEDSYHRIHKVKRKNNYPMFIAPLKCKLTRIIRIIPPRVASIFIAPAHVEVHRAPRKSPYVFFLFVITDITVATNPSGQRQHSILKIDHRR
jgi:hypothetical protein